MKNIDDNLIIVSKSKKGLFAKRLNKSSFFILPLIGIDNTYYGLINSYLGYFESDKLVGMDGDSIYVNIKYYDEKLRGNSNYKDYYQLKDNTYMYVFSIPDKFKNDFFSFVDGKYSLFSEEAKYILCKSSTVNSRKIESSNLYGILYKTRGRVKYIEELIGQKLPVDAELCSVVELEEETYEG